MSYDQCDSPVLRAPAGATVLKWLYLHPVGSKKKLEVSSWETFIPFSWESPRFYNGASPVCTGCSVTAFLRDSVLGQKVLDLTLLPSTCFLTTGRAESSSVERGQLYTIQLSSSWRFHSLGDIQHLAETFFCQKQVTRRASIEPLQNNNQVVCGTKLQAESQVSRVRIDPSPLWMYWTIYTNIEDIFRKCHNLFLEHYVTLQHKRWNNVCSYMCLCSASYLQNTVFAIQRNAKWFITMDNVNSIQSAILFGIHPYAYQWTQMSPWDRWAISSLLMWESIITSSSSTQHIGYCQVEGKKIVLLDHTRTSACSVSFTCGIDWLVHTWIY